MIARKHLLAIAVAVLIAGCGGGSDTLGDNAPQAAQRIAAQATLLPGTTVTPDEAARQLFDHVERTFPVLFPKQSETGALGPFAFRAYPGGIFIGVVVADGTPFTYGGVYLVGLFGGTLSQPYHFAQLTNIITPTDPVASGGSGNGCFGLALADTEGTHLEVTYQYSGAITGTQTVDTVVGGMTSIFQGQLARETTVTTSGTSFVQGFQIDGTLTGKNYARRTGDAEMTQYGSTFTGSGTASGFAATLNSSIVFNPAFVDRQYSLGVGQTFNASQTIVATGSASVADSTQDLGGTSTQSYSVTYVRQEPVSVGAVTYNTCRMQTSTTAGGNTTTQTNWLIVGKGIPVKVTTTAGGITQTIQASSVKVNGSSL